MIILLLQTELELAHKDCHLPCLWYFYGWYVASVYWACWHWNSLIVDAVDHGPGVGEGDAGVPPPHEAVQAELGGVAGEVDHLGVRAAALWRGWTREICQTLEFHVYNQLVGLWNSTFIWNSIWIWISTKNIWSSRTENPGHDSTK